MGSSNTAMDCAVDLQGHAEKIYVSNRHGGALVCNSNRAGKYDTYCLKGSSLGQEWIAR